MEFILHVDCLQCCDEFKKSFLYAGIAGDSFKILHECFTAEKLFQPGDCPDAALYCGWYSLGKYVDAFTWRKGAVAYHIASSECATLKQKGSQVWCKRMLEEGAAAVIGPVDEPYVQAFPVPEVFFGLLVEGSLTLAECYAAGTPWLSWRMVLIGDPLYRPFVNAGRKNAAANANRPEMLKILSRISRRTR